VLLVPIPVPAEFTVPLLLKIGWLPAVPVLLEFPELLPELAGGVTLVTFPFRTPDELSLLSELVPLPA
jgi:hypothetical protein